MWARPRNWHAASDLPRFRRCARRPLGRRFAFPPPSRLRRLRRTCHIPVTALAEFCGQNAICP
ncbi:hypothetical protein FYK34_13960 [Chromobacterium paludis]|uniref:Uncharacterized protein n=1 Tax=Chromobacterium paludis TaxID=2605945 RepID=A0A5C1DMC0_9NEIS|nr:hypothetical protein FYK34_13960 [Chromobacterium paludis]